jgi:hypothetical protein
VRKSVRFWLCVVILGALCSVAAQRADDKAASGEQFVGTWTGTWDGAGTGGFTLILEKGKGGAIAGRVAVTGEPTYTTTIKTLAFEGPKMTARYDFPENDAIEIVLTASFEDTKATGTWSAREKANGNEAATGGWTVTKK